jgi:hypothetical protein
MIKRVAIRSALAVTGVTLALAATAGPASASTGNHGSVSTSACTATLNIGIPSGTHESARVILNSAGNGTQGCYGWIEHSTNGGSTYVSESGVSASNGASATSGWTYDGPGNWARACVQQFGTGATTQCQSVWY